MSVDMMLHAMKSLMLVKLLAWFYFLSLFIQVLYFFHIDEKAGGPFIPVPLNSSLTTGTSLKRPISNNRRVADEEDVSTSLLFSSERIKTDDWHRLEGYEPPTIGKNLPIIVNLPSSDRRAQSDNRIIYFLHIHKSAGTSICFAARINHMSTAPTNCSPQQDQRCCGGADSLTAQQRFAMETAYTFVANERYMYDTMDPKHYRYVLMLRNSQERYRSHWKNVVHLYPDEISFPSWWQKQPDNWNVRVICGTKCMNVAKFQLTPDLFNYTLERLHSFENILFVERFNETFASLAEQVGWVHMPVPLASKASPPYAPFRWSWDPFMSALDDGLYEYAEALYAGVSQPSLSSERWDVVRSYFATGPTRMCTSPCCHDECSPY